MRILETSVRRRKLRFGLVGTCRVHEPFMGMVKARTITELSLNAMGYTQTPFDALQYLRYARGDLSIPLCYAPYIFGRPNLPSRSNWRLNLERKTKGYILELSRTDRIRFGSLEFQYNYFVNTLVKQGGPGLLEWWRAISRNGKNLDAAIPAARAELDDMMLPPSLNAERLLSTTTRSNLDAESIARGVREFVSYAGKPVLIVVNFDDPANDTGIFQGRRTILEAAKLLESLPNTAIYDTSALVADYGVESLFAKGGADLSHYAAETADHVGREFLGALVPLITGTNR